MTEEAQAQPPEEGAAAEEPPTPAPEAAPPPPGFLHNLGANLRALPGLALGRPRAIAALRPGSAQLIALFLLNLGAGLAYDFYVAGIDSGRFDAGALPQASFWAVAALLSAWAIAALCRAEALVPPLALAAFGLSLAAGVLADALAISADFAPRIDSFYDWLAWLPPAWAAAAYARVALRLATPPGARRLLVAALALGLPIASQWAGDSTQRLWASTQAEAGQDEGSDAPESEQTLYQQDELLQRSLDAVAEGHPGITELYTITFGGDGTQDVFLNEAEGADQVLAEVYGSSERGIVLANSIARPQEAPFATVSALGRALSTVAERMNDGEDVLMLVLSSHGDTDGTLRVALPPYRFDQLTPDRLRELLDQSGIRFRVIVVSACYAGRYIEPLATPDTMIITASAADRSSFGCRDGADWTDFGAAFFDQGLSQTASLENAFARASRIIADQEKAENLPASQPQIFVGEAIRERLKSLESQRGSGMLFARSRAAPHVEGGG